MNTALAQRQTVLPDASTWQTMMQMAGQLVESGMLPQAIKTPAAALAIMQKGAELGIPPMYALSNIGIINGRPVVGAEVLLAMIYRDHGDNAIVVEETTAEGCTVAYRRRGWGEARRFSWTADDAKRAGLLGKGGPWSQYPAAMLRARCISAIARAAFADSIGGMYTPEELGAAVEVVDGEVVVVDQPKPVMRVVQPAEVIEPTGPDEERARAMVDGGDAGTVAKLREQAIARCDQLAAHAEAVNHEKAAEIAGVKPEKLTDQKLRQWVEKLEAMFPNVEEGGAAAALADDVDEPF